MLLPEVFSDGKVAFEVLQQLLGDAVDERKEKYDLNWYAVIKLGRSVLTFGDLIRESHPVETLRSLADKPRNPATRTIGTDGLHLHRFDEQWFSQDLTIDSWIEGNTGATGPQIFRNDAKPSNVRVEG